MASWSVIGRWRFGSDWCSSRSKILGSRWEGYSIILYLSQSEVRLGSGVTERKVPSRSLSQESLLGAMIVVCSLRNDPCILGTSAAIDQAKKKKFQIFKWRAKKRTINNCCSDKQGSHWTLLQDFYKKLYSLSLNCFKFEIRTLTSVFFLLIVIMPEDCQDTISRFRVFEIPNRNKEATFCQLYASSMLSALLLFSARW